MPAMQSADLTLRLPPPMHFPAPEIADEAVHREEVLSWEVDPETERVRMLSLVAGDVDAVADVVEETDVVHSYDLTPIDEHAFYGYAELELRPADAELFGFFDAPGLVIVPPVVFTDRRSAQFTVLGEPDALSDLMARFPEDVAVDVRRVSDHRRRTETLAGRLTGRQFEAIETARELGYYEVPRTTSLADVADALGCSESAASTLLRTAEANLVDAALGR